MFSLIKNRLIKIFHFFKNQLYDVKNMMKSLSIVNFQNTGDTLYIACSNIKLVVYYLNSHLNRKTRKPLSAIELFSCLNSV